MHSVVLGLQCLAEMGRISIFHAHGSERQLSKQVCLFPSLNPYHLSSVSCCGGCTEAKILLQKQSLAERSSKTPVDAFCRDVSLAPDRFLDGDKRGHSLFLHQFLGVQGCSGGFYPIYDTTRIL